MKKRARDLLRALVATRGYFLVEGSDLDGTARDHFVVELLEQLQPDLVLDVGANCGQFRAWARNTIGYQRSGVSFEPLPTAAAKASEACIGDHQWSLRQIALGEAPGTAELNVMPGDGDLSSFLTPDNSRSTVLSHLNRVLTTIRVPVETLAAQIPLDDSVIWLKVDTQGSDLAILRSAGEALERVTLIQVELSFTPIYHGQPTASATIEFLDGAGFTLSGMYRNNRAGYPRRMTEADGYFIRKHLAP